MKHIALKDIVNIAGVIVILHLALPVICIPLASKIISFIEKFTSYYNKADQIGLPDTLLPKALVVLTLVFHLVGSRLIISVATKFIKAAILNWLAPVKKPVARSKNSEVEQKKTLTTTGHLDNEPVGSNLRSRSSHPKAFSPQLRCSKSTALRHHCAVRRQDKVER